MLDVYQIYVLCYYDFRKFLRFDLEESVFAFLKDKDNLIPEKLGITIYKDGRFRNYSNMEKIEKQIKNLNLSEIIETIVSISEIAEVSAAKSTRIKKTSPKM